ncbi:ATP-binding cassette domain-containing protein [Lysinibacillus piscis]|uniref:DNA topology modulation protein n=1 Tax=Lysinibacillus piscis TaxID=2518931 RepID=A0ABQ5NMX8_9BACI|nr:ATP-binding cassette domain-containing protein [Lysinibacillus sp. KH24]GLC89731.1 DNA topology modulation protein [Lysinibacillus sp. KH24]
MKEKIHIIGSVGSGKSTLARQIASNCKMNYIELDNIVWERHAHGDMRRSDEAISQLIQQVVQQNEWVTEGAHCKHWVTPLFEQADYIIHLQPSYFTRLWRIHKRFFKQVLKLEKSNYKPTLHMLLDMYKWNHSYEKTGQWKIKERLQPFQDKVVTIKSQKAIEETLKSLS